MGGRGAGSSGGGTGGVSTGSVLSTTSLISMRETKQKEVDDTLTVLRDIEDKYGVILNDVQVATMSSSAAGTMAYYDNQGNLAVTAGYFDSTAMDQAYDRCVKNGFHPSRGNKSGMEAVVAHEAGHRLTDVAGERLGYGSWALDKTSAEIMKRASRQTGVKVDKMRKQISGYGRRKNAEAIAEAFTDVYCNGKKASKSSIAVVNVLNNIFGV